jgi:hypothetical protein
MDVSEMITASTIWALMMEAAPSFVAVLRMNLKACC